MHLVCYAYHVWLCGGLCARHTLLRHPGGPKPLSNSRTTPYDPLKSVHYIANVLRATGMSVAYTFLSYRFLRQARDCPAMEALSICLHYTLRNCLTRAGFQPGGRQVVI